LASIPIARLLRTGIAIHKQKIRFACPWIIAPRASTQTLKISAITISLTAFITLASPSVFLGLRSRVHEHSIAATVCWRAHGYSASSLGTQIV
jgi:hypothetical protein